MNTGQVSSLVKDKAAAKDLRAFAKHLEELDATPQQVSSSNSPALSRSDPCPLFIWLFVCLVVYPSYAVPTCVSILLLMLEVLLLACSM